jgi:hypothetical protein
MMVAVQQLVEFFGDPEPGSRRFLLKAIANDLRHVLFSNHQTTIEGCASHGAAIHPARPTPIDNLQRGAQLQ